MRVSSLLFLALLAVGAPAEPSPAAQAAVLPKSQGGARPVSGSPQPADESQFFNREVRLLHRIVACAGSETVPKELEAVVTSHCELFQPTITAYKTKYLAQARPFLVALQPAGLPKTIVYPFGGGDLLSALTTYPDLTEVTTLSLEHAGDPRGIVGVVPKNLEIALEAVRRRVSGLLIWTESTSENMMQIQRGGIPGQLAFFLVGLAVHDQEPVSLRFFDLDAQGAVHGVSASEIKARESSTARKLNTWWKSPDFSGAFSNSEITFKKAGDANAPLRVHRHIAADISNDGLRKEPGVLKHLESKGRITAMTKAASYLLWSQPFSTIRSYLLAHMEFMLSDSTGIPPSLAQGSGFEVLAYGRYDGPFLPAPATAAKDMKALFDSQPGRELKFRYGYPDSASHDHLMLIRKREKPATSN